MLFSYNWLQSFFDKKLPQPAELARLIIGHSFEVESIEKSGKDTIFDIGILSNRPDCMSHIGIAREIGAILGYKLNLPKGRTPAVKNAVPVKSLIDVQVADAAACPRYSAKVVTGVKVGLSPKWMQERLAACGLRSINNIVDATNYVMLETGQPLHAFDWDKLAIGRGKSKKIIVRYASDGEKIDALGERSYELLPSMLLITDETGPLAIAGIKGGRRAEISETTSIIVIESANFNSKSVRVTSRNLGLATDASLRYAHGIDRGQTADVAQRVAELVVQIAGGQIAAGTIDRNPQPVKPRKLVLDTESAESLLGVTVQSARVKKILESLGLTVKKGNKTNLEVTVPSRRADIVAKEDLIEEIGRIDGYEKIPSLLATGPILPPAKNYFWFWKTYLRDSLITVGWSETRNYSFVSESDCRKFGFDPAGLLEIVNPVNEDFKFMRPSLLINLAKNVQKNQGRADLAQFEIGRIFAADRRSEPTFAAGISNGLSFAEVKGAILFAMKSLGITDCNFKPLDDSNIYVPGHSAVIMVGKKNVGRMGSLRENISLLCGIGGVIVFELDLDALSQFASRKNDFRPISLHPVAIRDLAILVPRKEYSGVVIDEIKKAAGPLAVSIEPIDIYEGGQIAVGLKNVAFRINYQSMERTLDGSEIDSLQSKVIAAIEAHGWQVRK